MSENESKQEAQVLGLPVMVVNGIFGFNPESYALPEDDVCVDGIKLAAEMVERAYLLVNFYADTASETHDIMSYFVIKAAIDIDQDGDGDSDCLAPFKLAPSCTDDIVAARRHRQEFRGILDDILQQTAAAREMVIRKQAAKAS